HALDDVRIVEQLDPNLDPNSFQLSDLQLGDVPISLPQGRGSFTGEFNLVQTQGYVLQVTAGVDVTTGIATWEIRAIDPETGLLLNDPNVGFLQPGQTARVGYTIRANPSSRTGDQINAGVRVIYGTDAPLDSNVVTNTLDAVAPTTTFSSQSL